MSEKTSIKNQDKLSQLSTEELVEIILTQQEAIKYLKKEVEREHPILEEKQKK